MSNNKILIFGFIFTIGFGVVLFWPKKVVEDEYSATVSSASADKIEVVMYKNPGCQCCTKWAALMNDDQLDHAFRQEFKVLKEAEDMLSDLTK